MGNKPVPLNGGTGSVALRSITIFACLPVSFIILIPVVNKFFRGLSQNVSGKCSSEGGNIHEGDGLDCVVSGDSSV